MLQNKAGSEQYAYTKNHAALLFPCLEVTPSHAAKTRNFTNRVAQKGQQPERKKKKRENVDLWLVKHGSAPDPYYLSVSLQYTEHNEAEI
jgi:hypothetical protein